MDTIPGVSFDTPQPQQIGNNIPGVSFDAPQPQQTGNNIPGVSFDTPQTQSLAVDNALKFVGQPLDQGYCETFAEQMTGAPNMGTSAAQAWDNYTKQGKAYGDINQAPSGSLIYFQPDRSNHFLGHVGIADGQGGMVSATDYGVQHTPLDQWIQMTGQQPLGYAIPKGEE